jgi:hypothetical protein
LYHYHLLLVNPYTETFKLILVTTSARKNICYGLLFHRINTNNTIITPEMAAIEGPGHVELSVAPNTDVAMRSRVTAIRLFSATISHLHSHNRHVAIFA